MIRACPRHPRSIEAYLVASAHILIPYSQVKTDLGSVSIPCLPRYCSLVA